MTLLINKYADLVITNAMIEDAIQLSAWHNMPDIPLDEAVSMKSYYGPSEDTILNCFVYRIYPCGTVVAIVQDSDYARQMIDRHLTRQ